ncbi:MAG: hypothetical protein A3I61_04015 [Acidobacteria bacterium RIFCSPLOWO2_02_FULL_68_18]|nr:MAG: hypothetical protein A3I61_04015 [Acidobacteria bacterium RIFCSPLOWO2_02_FULL_68_18]OFW48832.1 MAG: hypothetical protein A3G77_17950 [Acidobacteria bacterium RIFCSPLOWO2_12_FULL_68_19]
MAVFVINEWLWADSFGDNGAERQKEAFNVIVKLSQSQHRIVVIVGSRFDEKAWRLCKSTNTNVAEIAKVYFGILRINSDRCLLLKSENVAALSDNLSQSIKDDDHYLVRAQLSVNDAILVTTDEPLRNVVTQAGLSCLSREDFLATYF